MLCLLVNILFQGKIDHHNQEDGSRETQTLGPCWKSRRVACMANMESRLEFGLCAEPKLTPGLEFLMDQIKIVMYSNNNDTEVPEDQPEEQALQLDVKDFACQSKAKAKPQRREPAGYSPRTFR